MRIFLLAIIFLIGSLGSVLAQPLQNHAVPSSNYSVDYPPAWSLKNTNFASSFWLYNENVPDPKAENVHIVPISLTHSTGFDMVALMARHQVESDYPLLSLKTSKEIKIPKMDLAHRFEYAGEHNGKPFHLLQVLMRKDDTAYRITFGANDAEWKKHLPAVERMVNSFKYIP